MNIALLLVASAVLSSPLGLTSIAKNEEQSLANESVNTTLRIYNWADYIGENVIQEFKDYVKKTDGVDLDVVYATFDTNEIMLSQIETGSASYDLICPSDYMIQRMMANDMLMPFASGDARTALYGSRSEGWEDNYHLYASKYLQNVFSGITSSIGDTGETGSLADYARGYMWGTLGILYNPEFSTYVSEGLSADDVKVQMDDWNALWANQYKGTFQVKDSMRDTYSVALMKAYNSYFIKLKKEYAAGLLTESQYNADVTTIFNNISNIDSFNSLASSLDSSAQAETAEGIIDHIQGYLSELIGNSYGLEVDSGKTDIIDGRMSGIDLAWSGDAVYSMQEADALGNTLYYSIPKTGGNIWFDGWVLPKDCANQEYAQKFIDFISNPAIAVENMDYIGYTPFVAGDDILMDVREMYDPRMPLIYAYDETADELYYDDDGNLVPRNGEGVKTMTVTNDDGDEVQDQIDFGTDDFSQLSDEQLNNLFLKCGTFGGVTYSSWEDYISKNQTNWQKVDLTYFFDGSFSSDGGFQDDVDDYFYSSELETVTGKDLAGEDETVTVGREFYAQYPPKELIPSLALMEDYGDNNAYVLRMWEAVKSGSIPLWLIIVLSVEVGAALIVGFYFFLKKRTSKKLRQKRREAKAK